MKQDPDLAPLMSMLAAEREALLSGAYDQLESIATAKAELLSAFQELAFSPQHLEQLHARLEQNGALLKAALAGLEEGRIVALGMSASQTLTVYARDGAQQALRRRDATFERKM